MADETSTKTEPEASPEPHFERDSHFTSVYANNVQMHTTAWDVSLVFGKFDQHLGQRKVRQSTEVTMAWAETKAVCYLILSNMAFYEAVNGPIAIPIAMRPDPPTLDTNNPLLKVAQERLEQIQAMLFGKK